ncbi:Bifunctional protein PaaZ [Cupriavidus laharis]|uniref:Bifunctional protein PaaZ n=1 Tax=Cupriavidus laharis TaxID=151654 RepID=A0ABM8XHZ6_9BURK|nr:MaoC/PaaZ C-terminal domain-containing protein [Cupriavidus laharis]CAG9179789.1 Bifunctional protein PaaZ [Cupriavidus laharis]
MSHSYYFEDFEVGQVFESTARTVTETDLTMFSMLSGDWNPIHADAEFAAQSRYGQRVVHGTLGIAMATGMMHQLGIFERTVVAMMSLGNWRFVAPMLVGQTLHLRLGILEKEAGTSRRVGRINRSLQLLDQHGALVQDGVSDVLVLKRSAA